MVKFFVRISIDILLKFCDCVIVNEGFVIDCVDVDYIVINENIYFYL